jgi:cytoskeletal protein RodZ
MPGIGDTLREARMRQGLDIADVETKTKIRAKYLRALENEEFSMLPGATFVRTFLRTYAEQLGLDPHRLVDEYRALHEPQDDADAPSLGRPAAMRERERRVRPGGIGPGAVVALAVVAVIGLLVVLGITGDDDGGDGKAPPADTTAREQPTTTTPKKRPPRTSVTLQVVPAEPTYACVDRGEGTTVLFEGILDGRRTFRGRRVRVNLGKTSVRLRANGRAVPVEPGSNPVGFEFTPRRTISLPSGQRPCA